MWAAITTALTTLLPLLAKLILYIIERRENNDKLKEEFLRFISEMQKDLPVKLNSKYNSQLERLKEKYRQDQTAIKNIEEACTNWREGYEDLVQRYKELLQEVEDLKNEQK